MPPRKKKTTEQAEAPAPEPAKPTMEFYCVKQKKKITAPVDQVVTTKNGRLMAKSTCPECGTKLNRFVSKQAGDGLLSMLGIDSGPLKNIPVLGALLG